MGLRLTVLATIMVAPITVGFAGCGTSVIARQQCTATRPLTVTPQDASLDHMTKRADNSVQFRGVARLTVPSGCPQPTDLEALVYATWSNPDPTNIRISSADDGTNGVASCINATPAAVALTGTFKNFINPDGSVVGTPANLTYVESVILACK